MLFTKLLLVKRMHLINGYTIKQNDYGDSGAVELLVSI